MNIINELLLLMHSHLYLVSFLFGVLSEEALLLLAIFAGQSRDSLLVVFIFGFLGIITHDLIFFFISKTNIIRKTGKKIKEENLFSFVSKIGEKKKFIALIVSKFIYGTRVPMVLYTGQRKKLYDFIVMDSSAVFIWCSIMIPLGWFAGRGFAEVMEIVKGVEKAIGIIILFIILIYVINHFARKYYLRKFS